MNYYSHHIGDFDRATRHLSRIERSVYRDLLDTYYDTEQPLTLDRAALCRKILARSNEEATAVEQALNEFFIETPTGWYHQRCEEELEAYRTSNSQKSAAGKASAAKRASKLQHALNGNPTTVATPVERALNGSATNQEPITNNHKPYKNKGAAPSALPDWLPAASWAGYLEMRKKQKKVPTERAIELVLMELTKLHAAGQDIAAVLDKSTVKCWTDVYPILQAPRTTAGPPRASRLTASMGSNAVEFDDPFAKRAMT